MSRFDNELIKQADNAFQMNGLSGTSATPARQLPHLQNIQPYADAMVPAEVPVVEQVANLAPPAKRMLQVTDLDAADPQGSQVGEIVGMPGMSAVYALGGPDPENQPGVLAPSTGFGGNIAGLPAGNMGGAPAKAASVDPIDESLYQVYKASRDIRNAIDDGNDFDFSHIITASNEAATVSKFANTDSDVNEVVGTVASIILDIENDLVNTGDYKQASRDLKDLEGLLDEINKFAAKKNCKDCKGKGCDSCKKDEDKKDSKCDCDGKGCSKCEKDEDSDGKPPWLNKKKKGKGKGKGKKEATNGNQETNVTVDVRDLDDQAGIWDRARVMMPDFTTNVLEGEELNAEDAGYVPFYNDGSGTGIVPGQEPHKQEVFPMDATNPAYVPYQNALGAVQASREKIFESLALVERLEKLGMVQETDRAKHLAKFEQMDSAKLAGFVASLDLFEESGARQPRSQKVASGNSRLPEMGRLTTASTASREQLSADDWLMTL
jgi:hypothetical protein